MKFSEPKLPSRFGLNIFISQSWMYLYYGFHQVWYQGIVKATGFGVLEDLPFKILGPQILQKL